MPRTRIWSAIAVVAVLVSLLSTRVAGQTAPAQTFLDQMAKNISAQLDSSPNGHVVGYAFYLGGPTTTGAGGQARTNANAPAVVFAAGTKMTVASVSKVVTAIAAIRILSQRGVKLDDPIGPWLPSDWSVSKYVQNITFAQLLSHKAGVQDYGDVNTFQQYDPVKKLFSQPVSIAAQICPGAGSRLPQNAITMNKQPCYSNYNFAIFRILLPKVAGFPEDPNPATRPQTLADEYVQLVQQNVFDPVQQANVLCAPPAQQPAASAYAFAYNFPGNTSGQDWGDQTLMCGAAGWYLTVEDIGQVMASLAADDGRVLTHRQFDTMRKLQLGWDFYTDDELVKNGGWSETAGMLTTAASIFSVNGWNKPGPRLGGVLFLNSDVSDGPGCGANAQLVLENAYHALVPVAAVYPKALPGDWSGLGAFSNGVNAGVVWPDGNVYFFRGTQYVGVDEKSGSGDGNGVQPIQGNWPGLAQAFPTGIDAGVVWPDGRAYFFKGNRYVQVDVTTRRAGAAQPIQGNWPGLAQAFPGGIDTVAMWPDGYAYFFKGAQYVKYSTQPGNVGVVPGYPKPISGNWPGLFPTGVNAAVVWGCNIADFFSGTQLLRYRITPLLQP